MKLYINHKLEICANENGWPDKHHFGWEDSIGFDGGPSGWFLEGGEEAYEKALEKAKQESVPFDKDYDIQFIEACIKIGMSDRGATWDGLQPDTIYELTNDIYAEVGGVDTVWQFRDDKNQGWHDCKLSHERYMDKRQVARLKPVNEVDTSVKVWGDGFHINKIKEG